MSTDSIQFSITFGKLVYPTKVNEDAKLYPFNTLQFPHKRNSKLKICHTCLYYATNSSLDLTSLKVIS
jgi:hypothetical protein